jgi:hypothetical protein
MFFINKKNKRTYGLITVILLFSSFLYRIVIIIAITHKIVTYIHALIEIKSEFFV